MNRRLDNKPSNLPTRPVNKPQNETRDPFGKPPTTQTDFARRDSSANSQGKPKK